MSDVRGKALPIEGRSVLLVDDEPIVVDVLSEVFEPLAEVFRSAANGIEALAILLDEDFDFILMDIEMPRMNGMELFRHIEEVKPYLIPRIIFITGDTETRATRDFIKRSGCRYIDKPFMLKDLFEVMADPASGRGGL